jgi:hypothetical protein
MTYNLIKWIRYIEKTPIIEKIEQITFNIVEEGQGRGSEDAKKECNVNYFDFFFFSVSLMEVMGAKPQST